MLSRTLFFSLQTYDIVAVKKAAYRFSDVISVDIIPRSNEIECILHFPPSQRMRSELRGW